MEDGSRIVPGWTERSRVGGGGKRPKESESWVSKMPGKSVGQSQAPSKPNSKSLHIQVMTYFSSSLSGARGADGILCTWNWSGMTSWVGPFHDGGSTQFIGCEVSPVISCGEMAGLRDDGVKEEDKGRPRMGRSYSPHMAVHI